VQLHGAGPPTHAANAGSPLVQHIGTA